MNKVKIDQRDEAGWTVLAVSGPVDVATAPQLRQSLTEVQYAGAPWLAVDLDGVEFLDSFGLGVIVGAMKRAATHDGEVVVVCGRSRLTRLFEVTRLDRILRIATSLEEIGPPGGAKT